MFSVSAVRMLSSRRTPIGNRRAKPLAATIFAVLMLVCGATVPGWASNTTTTTLVVKSNGSAVTTVTAGSVVTLTASVTLGGNPVTTGQVEFCDATAKYCTDIHQLGLAQLTLNGQASISYIPGIGNYSYNAVFIPSGSHQGSTSSNTDLTVTGTATYPTVTSFTSVDSLGNYLFTATVVGTGGQLAAPTGTVSFLDTSNSNAVLTTAPLSPSIPGVSLNAGAISDAGNYPYGIVTADFNGDGIADFAAADYYGNSVTIELGNGDGTFNLVSTRPSVGYAPVGIVAADFNGDGKVDLATDNDGANNVSILLGNGNGTFTLASSPAVGDNPNALVAGDFNEDGNQDLAVTNGSDSTVTILLGNGNGTFTSAGSPGSGSYPYAIATGDFNKDGHLDLAIADSSSNSVQILTGDGTGAFTSGASIATGNDAVAVVTGDFNADGNLDLAVTDTNDSSVAILIGDGTGNFTVNPNHLPLASVSYGTVVADFNKDGIDDLAVASIGDGLIAVFLGNGDGTFTLSGSPSSGPASYFLASADFNGDGVPDLITTNYENMAATAVITTITETATATALSVTPTGLGLHNVEASYPGSTTTAPSISGPIGVQGVPSTTTSLVVSAGGNQIASVASGTPVTLTATVSGLALQPALKSHAIGTGVHPNQVANPTVGQVNFCDASASDCVGIHLLGTAQVTSAGTASITLVPGIGSHSYKAVFAVDFYGSASESSPQPLTVTGSYPTTTTLSSSGSAGNYTLTATVVGQTNLNLPVSGTLSFLDTSNSNALLGTAALNPLGSLLQYQPERNQATGEYPESMVSVDLNQDGYTDIVTGNYEDGTLTILLGKGDGSFTSAPGVYPGSYPYGLGAGDWNDDGIPDLAVASSDSTVKILLGNGDGTFTAGASLATGSDPYFVGTSDFNGDGKADLAVANYSSNNVTILLGNGDGTFNPASASPATGSYPYGLTVADFNGDHRPDLAVSNITDNTVSILLGNGDGTFNAQAAVSVGQYPYLNTVGDFNADGKPDLAVANYNDNTISILLGNGDGTFTAAANQATGSNPYGIAIADLNHDGKTDLVVANYDDNNVSLLLGNGDGTFSSAGTAPTGKKPYGLVVTDLNGDGVPDILASNYGDNTVSVDIAQLLQGSQATLTNVAPLGTGTHNVLASYPLTAPYAASQSTTVPLTAAIGTSALTLTANPAKSSDFGDQVILTATLSPFAPEGVSTNGETITFYNGSTSIGTGTLTNGVATLTLNTLPLGTDSLTASYPGDASLAASKSSALPFAVANNALTLSLQGGTTATTIAANGTATYAFMVTPGSSSTFGANVTFSVTGGPSNATMTFNPTSITAGSPATTVTLTVAMPANAAVKPGATIAMARRLSPIAFAMLLIPFAGRIRRSGKRMGNLVCLLLLLMSGAAALTGLSGCASSSKTTPVTPAAQNYTMTVTATSGAVSKTTTLTLTVN